MGSNPSNLRNMCGIAGGVGKAAPSQKSIISGLDLMKHRGPDDIHVLLAQDFFFGTCRLAITEIAEGFQPIYDARSGNYLSFNGEIYNYRELRSGLLRLGVKDELRSEAQIILKLFEVFGVNFVTKLEGMFAIAIFESRHKRLHLYRDRFGEKPLWYYEIHPHTIVFASEVRSLMHFNSQISLRPESLSEVLQFGYTQPRLSTFKEIKSLSPATHLQWSESTSVERTYWEPELNETAELDYETAIATTQSLITDSVKKRMHAERSTGVFLSGGIDSTLIASIMSQELGSELKTFTIGFQDESYDESPFAQKIASYLSSQHSELIIRIDGNLLENKIANLLDQPLADSSIIPTFLLANFACKDVTVALGGDGGDEAFGGYNKYLFTPLLDKLSPAIRFAKHALPIFERSFFGKKQQVSRNSPQLNAGLSASERYFMFNVNCSLEEVKKILNPELPISDFGLNYKRFFNQGNSGYLNRMVRQDLRYSLPGALLYKSDIATMGNSLELRSPFLDHNLFEFSLKLPTSYKIKGLKTKRILKDITKRFVPEYLIDRPKMGFLPPKANWLRHELRELSFDLLTDQTAIDRGWFEQNQIKYLLRSHADGSNEEKMLWPIIMLELWARKWL